MIAILTVCVLGGAAIFYAFLPHGVFIALMGGALGGSILAAATAVWIARSAEKRRTSTVTKAPAPGAAVDPLETRS